MNDIQTRLAKCFATVFPTITEGDIQAASPTTLPEWDSITAIQLLVVIEEEFETQIDFEHLAELDSFGAIERFLADRAPTP